MATRHPPVSLCAICLLFSAIAMLSSGCSNSSSPPLPVQQTDSGLKADQLLEKMQAVYREAKTYSDNSTFVQQTVLRSEGVERETPFHQVSLVFERPNKMRFTFQKTRSNAPGTDEYDVASDGLRVRSHASELPEQVHEAIAPLELTPDNFIPEPEMRSAIFEVSLENVCPQLPMLLAGGQFFPNDSNPTLLDEQKLGEANCYRVGLTSDAGRRVLWIDEKTFALRRMELPLDGQRALLDPRGLYSKLAIWIDFENIQFDAAIDSETFVLEVPEGSRRVRRLIAPPPPGPSPALGQPVGELAFTTLEGEELTSAALADKVVVLDFWFTGCQPCKMQTPTVDKVYQNFKGNAEVAFYAVSTDAPRVSNDVVAKTMQSWGGSMPVIRDSSDSGYNLLNVRVTPTTVLISRDGRLQMFQPGVHLDPAPLTKAIQDLVDGKDLAANAIATHQQRVEEYEQALEAATIKDSIVEIKVARPDVPAQQLPENLRLEQVWQSTPEILEQPGDVLAIASGSDTSSRILVFDRGKEIVELQPDGTQVDRHPLPEHGEQANGFLRSAIDGDGRRWYLASGVGWQKVYVWDDQWKSTLTFPDEPHSGIGDVMLADLTGTGLPVMYVGYWGGLGIHGGALDGRRLWANRRLDHVLQIVAGSTNAEKQRPVLCTSTRGTVMKLTAEGKPIEELDISGRSLMYVGFDQGTKERPPNFCGLAIGQVGQYTAVGFDSSGEILWSYDLPRGEYVHQIPRIQSVRLSGTNVRWQIAAADGSIHWLTETGELVDQFKVGDTLTGIAISQNGKTTLLWVATNNHLTAWAISPNSGR